MTDLTGFTVGGYEIREKIGTGGFGEVYRAFQPGVWRDVAMKVILPAFANNPEFIRRFEIEAQLIARLEHPHIVPLYDYWREPGRAYLVMRWLSGGNVHQKLRQDGCWPLSQVMLASRQICAALSFAHRQNVIHRDLKPANILLDEDGNAYLSDFGIAKLFDSAPQVTHEGIIGTLFYSSPEQIRNEPVTPQSDIYNLGIVFYEMLVGAHPFVNTPEAALVLKHLNTPLPSVHEQHPEVPAAIDSVIQQATAKDPSARFANADEFLAAFYQAAAAPVTGERRTGSDTSPAPLISIQTQAILTPPEPKNPYKGLRPFQEADAADFFGREDLVQRLLARLQSPRLPASAIPAAAETPTPAPSSASPGSLGFQHRCLAVVGPSGSGKSSVVKAGLIPSLRQGAIPGSQNWFVVTISPGAYPWEELEAALLRVAINPPPSLMEQLQQDERGLLRAVKRVLPPDESELLLVIDQFEELFILTEDVETRTRFLNSLRLATQDPNGHMRLVLTLRADFYDRPLLYPEFGEMMRQCTEIVLPMSDAELERAICSPAERAGLSLEPGLIANIIADVREQPGTLPLLQYALTELFEHRQDRLLTRAAYQAIGGVSGALAQRADELYNGLDAATQTVARQLVLRLITLGEGAEDTRRRVPRAELLAIAGNPHTTETIIELFGRHRLLSFDRDPATRHPTVEIAHDALIRQWRPLREWIDGNRQNMRQHRLFAAAVVEWERAGKDPDFLLRGARLSQFQHWAETANLALTQSETDYLQASLAAQAAQAAAETARRAREVALETRSRLVGRALIVVLLVTTLVALGLASYAGSQQKEAERGAAVAQSFALAASSQALLLEDQGDLALVLALEANRLTEPPFAAQLALSEAAYARGGTRLVMQGHLPVAPTTTQPYAHTSVSGIQSVAISPDNRLGLSGADDHTVRLWDLSTGQELKRLGEPDGTNPDQGHTDVVQSVAFSPDGRLALSGSRDSTLILWDLASGEIRQHFGQAGDGHTGPVWSVAYHPDGRTVLSGSEDGSLILWDVTSGVAVRRFLRHTGAVYSVAISPDGQSILSGAQDQRLILWDTETGKALRLFEEYEGAIRSVAFSPDGKTALTGALLPNLDLWLWDLATGQRIQEFRGHNAYVWHVAFSADGRTIFSSAADNTVRLWDAGTGQEIGRLVGHTQVVLSGVFSPDGRFVLTGSADNTMRLWQLRSGAEVARLVEDEAYIPDLPGYSAARFSPDGQTLLSGHYDGSVRLWQISHDGQPTYLGPETAHQGPVWSVAISPDGRFGLSGSLDKSIVLWDLSNGQVIRRLEGHDSGVVSVTFSPDGRLALSGGSDNLAIVWNLDTGEAQRRFAQPQGFVRSVSFSPDSRLALTSAGATLLLWDVSSGEVQQQLQGHTAEIVSAAISPDGRTALSGGRDGVVRWWDLSNGAELARLERPGQVVGVAFGLDGHYAVVNVNTGSVYVWDLLNNAGIRQFSGYVNNTTGMTVSADGRLAMSSAWGEGLIVWRLDYTLDDLLRWVYTNRYVAGLTCAEREKYRVAPGCQEDENAPPISPLVMLTPPAPAEVTFAPAAAVEPSTPITPAATPVDAGTAELNQDNRGEITPGGSQRWTYHAAANEQLKISVSADYPVNGATSQAEQPGANLLDTRVAVYAPDGRLLAENDDILNGTLSDSLLDNLLLPAAGVYTIEVRSYRDQTGGGYTLRLESPQILDCLKLPIGGIWSVAITLDGKYAVTGSGVPSMRIPSTTVSAVIVWDLANRTEIMRFTGHADRVHTVAITPRGKAVLSAAFSEKRPTLWSVADGSVITQLQADEGDPSGFITRIAISPDGRTAAAAFTDGSLILWDLSPEQLGQTRQRLAHERRIETITFTPDGQYVIFGDQRGDIFMWDWGANEIVRRFPPEGNGHIGWIDALAVSPDGRFLLSASSQRPADGERRILLWGVETGAEIRQWADQPTDVNSLAFSPDGQYAAAGSGNREEPTADNPVRLWNWQTGEEIVVFAEHSNVVTSVLFSPDGHTLFSTSWDGNLCAWDLDAYLAPFASSP